MLLTVMLIRVYKDFVDILKSNCAGYLLNFKYYMSELKINLFYSPESGRV